MNNTFDRACPEDPIIPALEGRSDSLSFAVKFANLLTIVLPFACLILAIIFLWNRGFSWIQLGLLVGMYAATGMGITVGFHRLLTHRAFETSRPIKFILAVLGSMAVEGPVLRWVATHRRHHQHSDCEDDPHSPHHGGNGFRGLVKGLWHAHLGWIFKPDAANLSRYVGDFRKDKVVQVVSKLFPVWVVIGLLVPTVLAGVITQSWYDALLGFIWGGMVRVFFVHHVTWSINSVCHFWGSAPFSCGDHSKNNFLFGFLGWGEGWHNNHHAFPTSARHGLRWWQFDISFLVIQLLAVLGLAWGVRQPDKQQVAARRLKSNSIHDPQLEELSSPLLQPDAEHACIS